MIDYNQKKLMCYFAGEENYGKGYFEGDMILSPDQKSFLEGLKDGPSAATKRALIKNTTFLWPNADVYYNFDEGVGKSNFSLCRHVVYVDFSLPCKSLR